MSHRAVRPLWAPLLVLALAATASAQGPDAVGRVATVRGKVVAERPGAEPRALGCRDPIYAGDRVVAAKGARAGLLLGEVFAHVAEGSALEVADAGALRLRRGSVRVVDPGESSDASLQVLDARARIAGNDLEGYVFGEKTGGYALLCEWDAPLSVRRGREQALAGAGQCVVAKPRERLYLTDAHDDRIGSALEDGCSLDPVIGGIDLHLLPGDVAAGPPLGPWSGVPSGSPLPRRSPCDTPGSGCGLTAAGAGPPGPIVNPPQPGPFPGGGGPPPIVNPPQPGPFPGGGTP